MILLRTQAEPQMLAFAHPHLGQLIQSHQPPGIAASAERAVSCAVDNGAFSDPVLKSAHERFGAGAHDRALRLSQASTDLAAAGFITEIQMFAAIHLLRRS
jgi:hypothetical protein